MRPTDRHGSDWHGKDRHGRPLRSLRLSVTDRCNLRCAYCMPEEEYAWLPRSDLLTFEEMSLLVDAFLDCGVERLRLTGGEPLLRRDLDVLVALLAAKPAVRDFALTTNGLLLVDQAAPLRRAGLHRLTVSLDTLRADRFLELTRRDRLDDTLAGIEAARAAGFAGTKIDSVVMRGVNDDELADLLEYGRRAGAEVRFIEYMDVGGATHWSPDAVVSRADMIERIAATYGAVQPAADQDPAAPADRFVLPDGLEFGIISSTTEPFCGACDRSRLTGDGMWYLCLYARIGTDLRRLLRGGADRTELTAAIRRVWTGRDDRGAMDRLEEVAREPLVDVPRLREDPHLEMHTRGG